MQPCVTASAKEPEPEPSTGLKRDVRMAWHHLRYSGVREVLRDGEDGLLVPESDPVALADALERLLRDPDDAARMASNARAAALDRHGRALMNQRYEDLFLQLAGQGTS